MGRVVIRDVPDDVIEVHRQRARARGHSLGAGTANADRGCGGLFGGREVCSRQMVAEFDAAWSANGRGPADTRRSRSVNTAIFTGAS